METSMATDIYLMFYVDRVTQQIYPLNVKTQQSYFTYCDAIIPEDLWSYVHNYLQNILQFAKQNLELL